MAGCLEGIRRALVLCLVIIAGTAIEQAPSVDPLLPTRLPSCSIVVAIRTKSSAYSNLEGKPLLVSLETTDMLFDTNMRSGLYPFFQILDDFGSLTHDYAHCSIDAPLSSVVLYPHVVLYAHVVL